jgi:hypothetical protein
MEMIESNFPSVLVTRTYETNSIGRMFISGSSAREYILAGLVPELAKRGEKILLRDCLSLLREPQWRAEAFTEIASRLEGVEKEEAVRAALSAIQEVENESKRRIWLNRLAPQVATLSPSSQTEICKSLCAWLSGYARQDVFSQLYCMTPAFTAAAGPEAAVQILDAIQDVVRWWP